MIHTLEFSRTSVSGYEDYVEIVFKTKSDAEKAQNYIENTDDACHNFSINIYNPPNAVSFEEWIKRFGAKNEN